MATPRQSGLSRRNARFDAFGDLTGDWDSDHLSQVLATFGVILFLNQGVKAVFGSAPMQMPMPEILTGGVAPIDETRPLNLRI